MKPPPTDPSASSPTCSCRVAFFGGSFDPPHLGHLAVARAARQALRLDRVLFAPVGAQPLKPKGSTASFPDRLAMTARYFVDLILLPKLLRALSGEPLKTLHAEIASHVSQRVAFFLSACRNGGIK